MNINAAAGTDARAKPASKPAVGFATRLTAAYTVATAATPINACGRSKLKLENPNTRADSPITHSAAGGLSTVMKFSESSDPKNHAVQSLVPACTAAA